MRHFPRVRLQVAFIAALICVVHPYVAYAQPADTPPPDKSPTTPAASNQAGAQNAVLSMDGSGGRVTLGDKVEQAKKAFPAPKGAGIMSAANFAVFQRDGWVWTTENPGQAFEVSLKDRKIAGIIRTVAVSSAESRKKMIEQTIQKIGKPTAQAIGKTAAMYAWDAKPNARFLIEMKSGLFGGDAMMMSVIGDQTELKMFNYRVDDVATTVKQMDMGAEALKNISKRGEEKIALPSSKSSIERKWLAEKTAVPSKAYPLAGFWKKGDCSEHFGLAIAPAKNGLYSISFCGPGGCFEPGTYRPNSKIVGDSAYKVIDKNTIEVKGLGGFDRYVRYPSR